MCSIQHGLQTRASIGPEDKKISYKLIVCYSTQVTLRLTLARAGRLHRVAIVLLWFRLMAGMVCGRVANAPERGYYCINQELSAAAAARLHRVAIVLLWFRLMAGMVCGRARAGMKTS